MYDSLLYFHLSFEKKQTIKMMANPHFLVVHYAYVLIEITNDNLKYFDFFCYPKNTNNNNNHQLHEEFILNSKGQCCRLNLGQ